MQLETLNTGNTKAGADAVISTKITGNGKRKPNSRVVGRAPAWKVGVAIAFTLAAGILIGAVIEKNRVNARKIIAAVNGTPITSDEFFSRLQVEDGTKTLRRMVQEELQLEFAKQLGVAPAESDVDARFSKITSQSNYVSMLRQTGQTAASLKHELRVRMSQENVMSQGVTVSDDDLRQYYKEQIDPANPHAQFYRPVGIVIRAILTNSKEQADNAIKQLAQQNPFGVVAQTYSIDSSKNNGGGGLMPPLFYGRSPLSKFPELENAVFAMKIGDQIGPIQVGTQWWIFHCENKAASQTLPFDKVRDDCRTGAILAKGLKVNGTKVDAEFSDFQKKAILQAFWKQYQPALQAGSSPSK